MDMQTLRETAREKMKGFCRLCPVCDGRACAGQMPGMGSPLSGASFQNNHKALADIKINLRVVHDAGNPDTSYSFFGVGLRTPILNGPIGGVAFNCGPYDNYEFQHNLMLGMQAAGSLGIVGDPGKPEQFKDCCNALRDAGNGGAIIKPYMDLGEIERRFMQAKEAGATVFGVDIDGAGIQALAKMGYAVGPKTIEDLKTLKACIPNNPFIVKGIMTVDDALRCVEAGVDGIVVSNHGGRVLDCTAGVAEVLPAIKRAVGDSLSIFADGSVRSGVDVLKYIALGAEAVLIGRPACWGVYGGGKEGVELIMGTYTTELRQAMLLTGCKALKDINGDVLFAK